MNYGNPYMNNQYWQNNYGYPQYQQPSNTISGRVVSRLEDIQVSEINMDGSMVYFPNVNHSEVYGKKWNPDGTISTVIFKAVQQEQEVSKSEEKTIDFEPILARLDTIEEQITKLFPKRRVTHNESIADDTAN